MCTIGGLKSALNVDLTSLHFDMLSTNYILKKCKLATWLKINHYKRAEIKNKWIDYIKLFSLLLKYPIQ